MKIVFLTGGSPATVFALAPLASATRLAGHEVLVASPSDMTSYVLSTGLPSVAVTDGTMRDFMFQDADGRPVAIPTAPDERLLFNGRGFGRLARACLPGLRSLAADWEPDLMVGGSLCYAAPVAAHELGAPWVRHTWDLGEPLDIDAGAASELAPELADAGLDGMPAADLWVDVCPPSLQISGPGPRQGMRFVPYNQRRPLEPWMRRRGERPRVCVTAGSRVSGQDEAAGLVALVRALSSLNVECVIAAPEAVADALGKAVPDARVGWFPLDTLLTTCDLIVHHGGGQTTLTALHAGVPQLLLPTIPKMVPPCRGVEERGAAITLPQDRQTVADIAQAAESLLTTPGPRAAAQKMRAEIAQQPSPAQVVEVLENLVRSANRR
ncbi:DUF1205 domain-containing protein [Streptomyces sp. ISL-10]|nr:DUF1205 domain-containing protein [Streptomyces sp. ISL-10]